jgi:hypothetical protein
MKVRSMMHLFSRRKKRPRLWVRLLRGGCVLALCVACGALIFSAIPGFSAHSHAGALTQDLEEVLALDPGRAPRHWKYIVMHHSGSNAGSAAVFDEWHRARGWRSLGYDFVIGNGHEQGDGVIIAGPRWRRQEAGAHANGAEFNDYGIGICLVGDFEKTAPTPAQWAATCALVRELCRRYTIPSANIFGHGQIRQGGGTLCPGKNFPLQTLRDETN